MNQPIRMANEGDAAAILDIYAPCVESTAISFETEAPNETEIARRLAHTLATHPWLVCEGPEGVQGYAYGSAFRARAAYGWSCEVSVYLKADCRRRGIGRRLYSALFDLLNRQGFCQAFAGITLPNPASVRLHESMGFEAIGTFRDVGFKFGVWHDVGWWQRALAAPPGPPQPVRPIRQILAEVDWSRC